MSVRMDEYTAEWYNEVAEHLIKKLDECAKNSNEWIVEGIEMVVVVITTHKNLNPCKGHGNILLPKTLKVKQAIINLKGVS